MRVKAILACTECKNSGQSGGVRKSDELIMHPDTASRTFACYHWVAISCRWSIGVCAAFIIKMEAVQDSLSDSNTVITNQSP